MSIVTVDSWPPRNPVDFRPQLEAANILFFPTTPFELPEASQDFLRTLDFAGGAVHKNISYRPASDRVTGIDGANGNASRLLDIMRDYSRAVVAFAAELLPKYAAAWKLDYASFRPVEEENRNLPLNKRNDLIHTDAFPSRPTHGDLILRVFTNIHPSKTRNWVTTDSFAVVAKKYARDAGLEKIAGRTASVAGRMISHSAKLLNDIGVPIVARSGYDRFMLHFHNYLKRNEIFQRDCAKYNFNFPPGSTWLTFTDVLPHSVHSGQHALEQTFIVSRASLADPAQSPLSVLERLCGRPLVEQKAHQAIAGS